MVVDIGPGLQFIMLNRSIVRNMKLVETTFILAVKKANFDLSNVYTNAFFS